MTGMRKRKPEFLATEMNCADIFLALAGHLDRKPAELCAQINGCWACLKERVDTIIYFCGCVLMSSHCMNGHRWHRSSVLVGTIPVVTHDGPVLSQEGEMCCRMAIAEKREEIIRRRNQMALSIGTQRMTT